MANTLPTTELPAIVPNARESHESDRLSPMTKYLPGGTLVRRIGADATGPCFWSYQPFSRSSRPSTKILLPADQTVSPGTAMTRADEVAGFAALRRAAGEVTGTVEDDDVPTVELARQSARLHHQDPVTGSECRDHRRGRDREGLDQRSPKQRCAECGHGEDHDPLDDEPSPPAPEGRVLVRKARLLAAELESFQAIVVTAPRAQPPGALDAQVFVIEDGACHPVVYGSGPGPAKGCSRFSAASGVSRRMFMAVALAERARKSCICSTCALFRSEKASPSCLPEPRSLCHATLAATSRRIRELEAWSSSTSGGLRLTFALSGPAGPCRR